jgi:hypothetical protein
MINLTKEQRQALHTVWLRNNQGKTYREFRTTVQPQLCGDSAVMVQWCGMWLGIEPDGYTHS